MTINGVIHIPISDAEIELVEYELLKNKGDSSVLSDYWEQLEKDLKQMKETHLIPENRIKQFFSEICDVYTKKDIALPNPFESVTKFAEDTSKPYHELLTQTLQQFNYNEEQFQEIDRISSTYSSGFERARKRNRRTREVTDNSAQLQAQIKEYFRYATILAKIDKLANDVRDYDSMLTVTNDIISEIDSHQLPLNEIKESCINFNSTFSTDFVAIREQINRYNEYMQNYYQEHISPIQDFENGQDFNFIVHRVTSGFPDTLEFKTNYVSASLITNKTMGLYGGFNEHRLSVDRKGFILEPTDIVSAQHKDTMTGNRENKTSDLFYRQGFAILTPQTIEQRCLDQAKGINSDQLSENAKIYSEIVTDGFKPSAVFCITNGEGTLNPDYAIAKEQAKKYGLPLVDINQREYRKKVGLSPLTDIGEINLTREVIQRIMPDHLKSINDFETLKEELMTDDVCKNIANKFNQMSDQQRYSEEDFIKLASDILREQLRTNDVISEDRKVEMSQAIDGYFKNIEEPVPSTFSKETQELLDEADILLQSQQSNIIIEHEEAKQEQSINDFQDLNELSIEQLNELSRTGKVQTPIEQNLTNNKQL